MYSPGESKTFVLHITVCRLGYTQNMCNFIIRLYTFTCLYMHLIIIIINLYGYSIYDINV